MTTTQIQKLREAEGRSRAANSPAKHASASLWWQALAADASFSDDDRDAFARRAVEHEDKS